MAATKLRLRNDRIGFGKTTVYVQYVYKSKNYYFSTNEKIEPEQWLAARQKVAGNSTEVQDLNGRLLGRLATINRLLADAQRLQVEPTPAYLREQLTLLAQGDKPKKVAKTTPTAKTEDFLDLFEQYIQATQATKAHGTVKHYKTTLNHLKAFAAQKRRKLTLARIDAGFYHDFVTFLTKDKAMTNGTANNQLKRVKVVMGYAGEQGLTDNAAFRKFKTLRHTETGVVYLTKDELEHLASYDLTAEPRLARVRDLFVLACTTGLRHSDFSTVRPD